jgi:MerR family transcriptional regulator, thiopeptide resistance regulator
MSMKVGELAERTGLSVRTLHHYEEMGLIAPAQRTQSGHRLYEDDSVARVQKIVALKQLGMSLDEIRSWLTGNEARLLDVIRTQRGLVKERMLALSAIARRLEIIDMRMSEADTISVDDILEALEAMTMFEKYYTQEQLQQLDERAKALGEDGMRAVQEEWPQLIAKVRDAMDRGLDPKSEEVQVLTRRWHELIEMFTGGDPGIRASLQRLYENEPQVSQQNAIDPEIMKYVQKSWDA